MHKILHLYYYFNFRDPSTQTCENFLRSILFQLLYSLPDIPDVIVELYLRHNSGTLRPSVRDMTDCFIAVVNKLDKVRLFGDAFDECTGWNDLWYFLSTIVKIQCPVLHFLFTGRPGVHIQEAANALRIPSVDLDCEGINQDIEVFVSNSLARDIRFSRTLEEGKGLIRDSLISRANGMCVPPSLPFGDILTLSRFRWVALQLEAVSKCRSLTALRHALFSLPCSLDDTYRRILESIEEEEQARVRRILQWLCFTERPLRVEEIAVIYQVADRIQPPFSHDDGLFHPEEIIGICQGLLSLSILNTNSNWVIWRHFSPNNLQIVQLAHFSVKEYLCSSLSSPWTIDQSLSHVTILKGAIAYYLHFMTLHDIQSLRRPELVFRYSLAHYFVKYLPDHLAPVGEHSDLLPSLQLLLHPPSTPVATKLGGLLLDQCKLDDWRWQHARRRKWDEPINELVVCDPATNLYLAIRLQLPQICQSLLAMTVCMDLARPAFSYHKPVVGCPPLIEAVQYGDKKIIHALLDARARHHYHGLDPLADGSVLEEAVRKHDIQVVQILLEAANDIQGTATCFGRSLHLAVVHGHNDLIVALLAAGADPNGGGDMDTAALVSASRAGNEEIVQILLGAGADVNMICDGETALEAASHFGHAKIVKLLLDAGADINGGDGWALHSASSRGFEEVVCILIEAGACVNTTCNGETALETASCRGHAKIVKMLLDAGADVNGQDDWALYSASDRGYEEVVHILIEAGADVNMKPYEETALQTASCRGHTSIVKMLLDAGADVNEGNGRALYSASDGGHEEIVHILVEAGAVVNLKLSGQTALEIAAYCGHVKVVRILLDAGADANAGDGWALYSASDRGYEEVVHVLIEAGAAINQKCFGETALDRASHCGHVKIVQMLLKAGAMFGNLGGAQNHSHPSFMIDEDEDDEEPEEQLEEEKGRKRKRINLESDQTSKKTKES
jgi:ankyrin repeat protein